MGHGRLLGAAATVDELRHTQPEPLLHGFINSVVVPLEYRWRNLRSTWAISSSDFLQMVAVPLIITSLICGITGLGDAASLGGMFLRTILYYVCTSAAAITIRISSG